MSIAAYVAKLSEGISNSGILGFSRGGTGVSNPGSAGSILVSDGSAWVTQVLPKYVNLSMVGTVSPPFTGIARFYPPVAMTVNTVYANIATAPTGGNLTFTLNKNGSPIGTTFTISSGTTVMTPVTIDVSLTTTDYLTLDVAGPATFARDLYVRLKYL